MIDLHCHILPGLDDGPKTMEESIEMCRRAANDGIRTIVATPHRGSPAGHTNGSQVLKAVQRLATALSKSQVNVKVVPGQEIHIDTTLIDDIEHGSAMTVNNNNRYILLETPFTSVPFYVYDVVTRLKEKGIITIIAHPERNAQIQQNPGVIQKLCRTGALSQITGGSLLGQYGSAVQLSAVKLLKLGFIHVIASDSHSLGRPPMLSEAYKEVLRITNNERMVDMLQINSNKILKGEPILTD